MFCLQHLRRKEVKWRGWERNASLFLWVVALHRHVDKSYFRLLLHVDVDVVSLLHNLWIMCLVTSHGLFYWIRPTMLRSTCFIFIITRHTSVHFLPSVWKFSSFCLFEHLKKKKKNSIYIIWYKFDNIWICVI
jgi:hypothetical protein